MRVLVTGASGFVGGRLTEKLRSAGHAVTALVRRTSNRKALERLGVQIAFGDLHTGDGLDEAVTEVECVFHLAGLTKARTAEEYHRANSEGTRLLCQALAQRPQPPRLVYCSSLAAAGPTEIDRPRREDEAPAPVSRYGRSKLAGELAVRQFCQRVPSVIVRPPVVYGPGDVTNVPPLLTMSRLGVYVKPGFGPKQFSLIHIDDLCDGLIAAATKGKTLSPDEPTQGVYFLSDPAPYSYDQFFEALHQALGKGKPRVVPVPQALGYAVGLTSELAGRLINTVPIMNRDKAMELTHPAWTCSPERARAEIDFAPAHTLKDGLAETIDWYRKEGWVR